MGFSGERVRKSPRGRARVAKEAGREREFMAVRRRLLGGEVATNSYRMGPGPLRVAVVYPGSYAEGMASLSVHVLLDVFNRPPCRAERLFIFPELAGPPRSLETATVLGDFDLVLLTLPFEMQYLHVAPMLRRGGVAPRAAERGEGSPVVIAGGPAPSANPAPVAAVADLVYVGEVERRAGEILDRLEEVAKEGRRRDELVAALAGVEGMLDCREWLGGDVDEGGVRHQTAGVEEYVPRTVIVSAEAELSGRGLVEVARGCPYSCKFCLARAIYAPHRPRRPPALERVFDELAVAAGGVGMVCPSFADHPDAGELVRMVGKRGAAVSVASLRADQLARKAELAEALRRGGQRTITLAPETASERLRAAIGKPLDDDALDEATAVVAKAGFQRMKLYFMIGLPGEEDDDVAAIGQLMQRVRSRCPGLELSVSVSCFVPKAGTAYEWVEMASLSTLRRRAEIARQMAERGGASVRVESPRLALLQATLSRGGHEVGQVVAGLREGAPGEVVAGLRRAGVDVSAYAVRGAEERPWRVVSREPVGRQAKDAH